MPFPTKLLNDDEEIVLDLHPHWIFFVRPLGALLGSILLGIVVLAKNWDQAYVEFPSAILVLVSLGWFLFSYAKWATTNFVITTDRLVYRHGVLAKKGVEIPLERVNTVFFSQSIFERMIRSGDLAIESAGERGLESFSNVRRPSAVQNEIYKQMEANETRKFDRIAPRAPATHAPSIPEQIQQLDALRQSGALTDEEFNAKKADLLKRM